MPYQVILRDPNDPKTKGKVYQVEIVGGGIQTAEMPLPSEDNEGMILQYTGETDTDFTHGYFYECIKSGSSYVWQQINVQPAASAS